MDVSYFTLLTLGRELEARMICFRSFLIEATNFRVGTFFNNCFRPFSIWGVL
jgi:hypothetical protein